MLLTKDLTYKIAEDNSVCVHIEGSTADIADAKYELSILEGVLYIFKLVNRHEKDVVAIANKFVIRNR